jgi:endonuclease/exonuclease/phosphatase (EEP) superfamily protein YafD
MVGKENWVSGFHLLVALLVYHLLQGSELLLWLQLETLSLVLQCLQVHHQQLLLLLLHLVQVAYPPSQRQPQQLQLQ